MPSQSIFGTVSLSARLPPANPLLSVQRSPNFLTSPIATFGQLREISLFRVARYLRTRVDYRDHLDRARLIVARHPYRVLGNSMALAAWRNGAVEEIHCGWAAGHSVDHRRATDDQGRELMSFTPAACPCCLRGFGRGCKVRAQPRWPENLAGIRISPRFTCSSWSMTESCSVVELEHPEPTPKPVIERSL